MDPVERRLKEIKVLHIDLRPLVTATVSSTVRQAIEQMRAEKPHVLLLVDGPDEHLAGIFTERDILDRVVLDPSNYDRPVKDFMTPDPITLTAEETLAKAVHLMHRYGFRRVPIVDAEGRPAKIVGQMDIVKFLADEYADTVLNLPPQPDQVMQTPEGG